MEQRPPAQRRRHAPPPQVRTARLGEPKDALELAPVIDRLILGVLAPAGAGGA